MASVFDFLTGFVSLILRDIVLRALQQAFDAVEWLSCRVAHAFTLPFRGWGHLTRVEVLPKDSPLRIFS
jgi:hypothetical protein